jgi:peptidylprolyl isomerase
MYFRWLCFYVGLLGAVPAWAQQIETPPPPAGTPAAQPYLPPGAIDYHALLKGPPAADSPADEADSAAIVAAQKNTDDARWQVAGRDAGYLYARFSEVIGRPLDRANLPATIALLNRARADVTPPMADAKKQFLRPRPFQRFQLARVCGMATAPAPDPNPSERSSYPSGHSAYGWTTALVLAEVLPARAAALKKRAAEYAESRVICGVHFPTDVEGGRLLAEATVAKLKATSAFLADVARAKAEFAGTAAVKSMDDILAAAPASDWRAIDPANTLYMDLATGRVIIELAPEFSPNHVANIKALVRENYFDGLAVVRSQDNYVAQWADPDNKRPIKKAKRTLPAEFARDGAGVPFTLLPDGDVYAREVGFTDGFPAAREPATGQTWLAHCYGMVGAGRDEAADSGGGTELYAVTGHAPRHLDRNVTLVGRIIKGVELLSALPRGHAAMGFYEKPEERTVIKSVRIIADLPAAERLPLEALKTDSATFTELVESRRNRRDSWFKTAAGRIELCNVPLPVRERK